MYKFVWYILLFLWALTFQCSAKLVAVKDSVPGTYNFWLYSPKQISDSDTIAKPLVIFLHGRSLCGSNMNRVLRYGSVDAIIGGRHLDGYLIAPQSPGQSWNPGKIMKIVDWVIAKNKVDTTRIYVLGMSMGGYGTLDLVATYPNRIAAAMALCGGLTVRKPSNLNKVPLWIIHGTADRAVSVNESRKVVNAMKKSGNTDLLRYDEWKGASHGRPARIFYLNKTYEWLFKHSLTDTPRVVNKEINITPADLRHAYGDGFNHRETLKSYQQKYNR